MTNSDWIALIGISAGFIGFSSGLYQYIRAQKWRRAEFVSKEIKEFEAKNEIKITLQMLDWDSRHYNIPKENGNLSKVLINNDHIISALVPHNEKTGGFKDYEIFIRDNFDVLLDSLERFEHFIQSSLVNHKEFYPYLKYWIHIIGNINSGRKPKQFYRNLWLYINFYEYTGVQKLLKRYGYDIAIKNN